MTLPFYQNVKLGPTPTFYYQPPILGFFDFTGNKTFKTRQNFLRTKSKNKYQVATNYHSLKMSTALLSSFRTAVLLTLFFDLV